MIFFFLETGSQNDYLVKAASTHLWPELEIIDEEEGNMDSEGLDEQVPENAIAANQRKDEEFLIQFKGMEVCLVVLFIIFSLNTVIAHFAYCTTIWMEETGIQRSKTLGILSSTYFKIS
jgi:hypothetical protein